MKTDYFTIPEITVSYKDNVKTSERALVKCSADAASIMAVTFENCMQHHEEVYALFLNRANRVLGISCIGKGGLDGAVVDIRIILQTALITNCNSLLICHNHPSGSTQPSHHDIQMTQKIQDGCKTFGIRFFDHLIITDEGYTSFADEGLL